jgi:hypothetical protein
MPSQYDTSYHWEYSKPNYDTVEDKIKAQTIMEADYVFERRPPREPTRKDELEYMVWLEDEFNHDPWFTPRFRKYMAGPKRWPWKNQRDIKNQYQYTWFFNFLVGAAFTWPLGVWIARKSQTYQGGVPIVPYNRYIHDFPNLEPTRTARRAFRKYHFLTCCIGGAIFAYATVDQRQKIDAFYTRPDLKPFKAMVPKEELDEAEK